MESVEKITLSLPKSLATRLRVESAKSRRTMSDIGIEALDSYLPKEDQEELSPKEKSSDVVGAAA